MSEQWYCPDCGPITKMREEFLSGGYMCAECEAPASPIPAFVTVLQQQIAERDARIATLEAACEAGEGMVRRYNNFGKFDFEYWDVLEKKLRAAGYLKKEGI
jgi:hypothetical protein